MLPVRSELKSFVNHCGYSSFSSSSLPSLSQTFPLRCFGFLHNATDSQPLAIGILIGPSHIITPLNIPKHSQALSFSLPSCESHSTIIDTITIPSYSFSLCRIANNLGERFGYLGIVAVSSISYLQDLQVNQKSLVVSNGKNQAQSTICDILPNSSSILLDQNNYGLATQQSLASFFQHEVLGAVLITPSIKVGNVYSTAPYFSHSACSAIHNWITGSYSQKLVNHDKREDRFLDVSNRQIVIEESSNLQTYSQISLIKQLNSSFIFTQSASGSCFIRHSSSLSSIEVNLPFSNYINCSPNATITDIAGEGYLAVALIQNYAILINWRNSKIMDSLELSAAATAIVKQSSADYIIGDILGCISYLKVNGNNDAIKLQIESVYSPDPHYITRDTIQPVERLHLISEKNLLLIGSMRGVNILDIRLRKEVVQIEKSYASKRPIVFLGNSNSRYYVAGGDEPSIIRVYEATGKLVRSIQCTEPITSAAFINSAELAVPQANQIRIINVISNEQKNYAAFGDKQIVSIIVLQQNVFISVDVAGNLRKWRINTNAKEAVDEDGISNSISNVDSNTNSESTFHRIEVARIPDDLTFSLLTRFFFTTNANRARSISSLAPPLLTQQKPAALIQEQLDTENNIQLKLKILQLQQLKALESVVEQHQSVPTIEESIASQQKVIQEIQDRMNATQKTGTTISSKIKSASQYPQISISQPYQSPAEELPPPAIDSEVNILRRELEQMNTTLAATKSRVRDRSNSLKAKWQSPPSARLEFTMKSNESPAQNEVEIEDPLNLLSQHLDKTISNSKSLITIANDQSKGVHSRSLHSFKPSIDHSLDNSQLASSILAAKLLNNNVSSTKTRELSLKNDFDNQSIESLGKQVDMHSYSLAQPSKIPSAAHSELPTQKQQKQQQNDQQLADMQEKYNHLEEQVKTLQLHLKEVAQTNQQTPPTPSNLTASQFQTIQQVVTPPVVSVTQVSSSIKSSESGLNQKPQTVFPIQNSTQQQIIRQNHFQMNSREFSGQINGFTPITTTVHQIIPQAVTPIKLNRIRTLSISSPSPSVQYNSGSTIIVSPKQASNSNSQRVIPIQPTIMVPVQQKSKSPTSNQQIIIRNLNNNSFAPVVQPIGSSVQKQIHIQQPHEVMQNSYQVGNLQGSEYSNNLRDLSQQISKLTDLIYSLERESNQTVIAHRLPQLVSSLRDSFDRTAKESMRLTADNSSLKSQLLSTEQYLREARLSVVQFDSLNLVIEQSQSEKHLLNQRIFALEDENRNLKLKLDRFKEEVKQKYAAGLSAFQNLLQLKVNASRKQTDDLAKKFETLKGMTGTSIDFNALDKLIEISSKRTNTNTKSVAAVPPTTLSSKNNASSPLKSLYSPQKPILNYSHSPIRIKESTSKQTNPRKKRQIFDNKESSSSPMTSARYQYQELSPKMQMSGYYSQRISPLLISSTNGYEQNTKSIKRNIPKDGSFVVTDVAESGQHDYTPAQGYSPAKSKSTTQLTDRLHSHGKQQEESSLCNIQ